MLRFIREYLLAVQFFTRIPVTGRLAEWVGFSPGLFRGSAAHFPAVGMLVGAWAALVYGVVVAGLPDSAYAPLVAAALSTIASVLMTGAFHEDGLADVADGLGGSSDAGRALEIMKDSRVGAYGALALVLAVLAKVSLVALLGSVELVSPDQLGDLAQQAGNADGASNATVTGYFDGLYVCAALWLGHVVSRGLPLVLIRFLPHVGDHAGSKSKPLAETITTARLLIGAAWCVLAIGLASFVLSFTSMAVGSALALVALLWMGRLFKRRLGGFTGDCLGATQQVCEIAFYLGLAFTL